MRMSYEFRISPESLSKSISIRETGLTCRDALDLVCGRLGIAWRIEKGRIVFTDSDPIAQTHPPLRRPGMVPGDRESLLGAGAERQGTANHQRPSHEFPDGTHRDRGEFTMPSPRAGWDASLDTNGIGPHERALRFREGGGVALDVGCGCNDRFPPLARRARLLRLRPRCVGRNDRPGAGAASRATFHHADVVRMDSVARYDFITAWDSIWHVPLDPAEVFLSKTLRSLAPGGVFLWTTGGVDGP